MESIKIESYQKQVLDAHNEFRKDPQSLIPELKKRLKNFEGKDYYFPNSNTILKTKEGSAVVKETIVFLEKQKRCKRLSLNDILTRAAKDHALDQSKNTFTGHKGSDGSMPKNRVERYGQWTGMVGENLAYGNKGGRETVISLMIDDGVPDRGHRIQIFSDHLICGIWREPFKNYGYVTVVDYAQGIKDKIKSTN